MKRYLSFVFVWTLIYGFSMAPALLAKGNRPAVEPNGNQSNLDMDQRVENLKNAYDGIAKGEDVRRNCQRFFNAFPDSFDGLQKIYGYDTDKGEGPLYSVGPEHIADYFNHIDCVSKEDQIKKQINISLGGHWDADSINFFQEGLRENVLANPELTFRLLESRSDEEVVQFFTFFFDEAHSESASIPNVLKSTSPSTRMTELMNKGFQNVLTEPSH